MYSFLNHIGDEGELHSRHTITLALFLPLQLPILVTLFLYMASNYCLISFCFCLNVSLQHFLYEKSTSSELLRFSLSENVFLLLSLFLKDSFPHTDYLVDSYFFLQLQHFNFVICFFWSLLFFMKNQLLILFMVP